MMISFGLQRNVISREEIVDCEPASSTFNLYGGFGVRLGLDGSLAYTTSFGNAVRIRRKGRRPFVFPTNNPENVVGIFNDMRISGAIGPLNCKSG